MNGTLNVHRVFKGSRTRRGYLAALGLKHERQESLRDARDRIRKTLREEMPDWNSLAKAQRLVEYRHVVLASQLPRLSPKFRMQGSSVYDTLNFPAHLPPQEVDFDDGVFLPTSFVNESGSNRPVVASRGYFAMVEEILGPLCADRGWELDRGKSSCVRVRIDADAHVDLALYAIPDEDFTELEEARAMAQMAKGQVASELDFELADEIYTALLEKRIMLAHRDSGWIESDPREIENWFLDAIADHGKAVRRVCRYLKGWRDFQWMKGGPSSITLMACVVAVYDELNGTLPENRDDLALQAVAGRLEALFSRAIPNPVLPDQQLDEDWSAEKRSDYRARARGLKTTIDTALNRTYHKTVAIAKLREGFGVRIPDDELLIDIESEERKVRAYAPAVVAAPFVPRTTSG
ncbi:MAG: CBASS cGAMP synthase [Rhodobacteraceae bacterium]|nr:CBASS cGAMP synthase [Paracoccaceae bacterium]